MKFSNYAQALGMLVAVTLLAGCGGSQQQVAPAAPAQPGIVQPLQGRLSMTPGTRRFAPRLWYISNFYDSTIDIYTIPGLQFKGTLTGAVEPQGMCTTGKKTFWVANSGADDMLEYEYGGTSPVKTLTESVGEPADCSIDPSTGNLAMSVLFTSHVLVWTNATGSYTTLTDPLLETYFVAYDTSGDLFAVGFNSSFVPALVELKKGSTKWINLLLPISIPFPGGIQWDGEYLAIGVSNGIDQLVCSNSTCTQVGHTPVLGGCAGFWIDKGVLACSDIGNDEGQLYHYPAGGPPYAHVSGLDGPIANAIVK